MDKASCGGGQLDTGAAFLACVLPGCDSGIRRVASSNSHLADMNSSLLPLQGLQLEALRANFTPQPLALQRVVAVSSEAVAVHAGQVSFKPQPLASQWATAPSDAAALRAGQASVMRQQP